MLKFQATKEFYLKNKGKRCKVGNRLNVQVAARKTESRGGSWERGFRFYESSYAMLVHVNAKTKRRSVSFDHGKTWHESYDDGKAAFTATKGKMRLDTSSHGELAFHGIQQINRDYGMPAWRR